MVRAGVVNHPKEWPFCGYNEIQNPKRRYAIIDYEKLISLLQKKNIEDLQRLCKEMVESRLSQGIPIRDKKWSKNIAVGTKEFIEATVKKVGISAKGRKVIGSAENSYFWNGIQ